MDLFPSGARLARALAKGISSTTSFPPRVLERRGEVVYSRRPAGKGGWGFLPPGALWFFINSSPNPVLVPRRWLFLRPRQVRATTNLMVPGKTTRYEVGVAPAKKCGRAEVEVEALEKGTVGNVEARPLSGLRDRSPRPCRSSISSALLLGKTAG